MHREPTPGRSLDSVRKEAKRWLKALRANAEEARARLARVFPTAPEIPTLRDVQHALALEHGLPGWTALKDHLASHGHADAQRAERVNTFLELACADPILANGPAAHARRSREALRMLKRYPEIARDSIHTAVVCGDLQEVKRILAGRPAAAAEAGGPVRRREIPERKKVWTPLLHLCYGRLPLAAASDNSVAIALELLDHGADPNDLFQVGSHENRYTALTGVAGEGEDDAPPHPQREALARLLLERGAEPYDTQLFYNTHFHGDIIWILELVYEYSVKAGRKADWDDPEWSMIGMGGYGYGARYFLGVAIASNNIELAEWLLTHGASPNASPPPHPNAPKNTLYEEAVRRGLSEIAELLVRFGATSTGPVVREGIDAFVEACFRLDREQAAALVKEHPEYLQSPLAMFLAAARDRADVVALLLDLGMSIEIEDKSKQRPLHVAASHDAFRVAEFLIARGADTEAVETDWDNTPLDAAMYGNQTQMIQFLSRFSRDPSRLAWIGNIERLRELLAAEPDLAKVVDDGSTPLMWLTDDEPRAIEIAELLMAHGADPSIKNKNGLTAADVAERRALYDVAEVLRARGA
jgi:ankyrin repeat protein